MISTILAILYLGVGTLCLLLGRILIRKQIPKDPPFCGFRMPQSLKSDENWYEINAYGGKCMMIGSIPMLALGVFGFVSPGVFDAFLPLTVVVFAASLMMMILPTHIHAERLDKHNG
ncbi:MAG: SdpI family protein [Verrucomicrobiae bacterium]|nr:SdpI family protein [Verrucomicrobiae bacterium]